MQLLIATGTPKPFQASSPSSGLNVRKSLKNRNIFFSWQEAHQGATEFQKSLSFSLKLQKSETWQA